MRLSSATASEGEKDDDNDEEKEEEAKPLKTTSCPPSQPLEIGRCSGSIETTVKIKQNDLLPGPKVCVSIFIKPVENGYPLVLILMSFFSAD